MSKRTTPEDAAMALLAAAGFGGTAKLPIDVDWIATEHDGLDIQERADLRGLPLPGVAELGPLSGLLLPGERRIWVDALETQRSAGRRRFTIAHELGHWHLHHARDRPGPASASAGMFCRETDVGPAAGEAIEREANRFAAALLMPEELVRAQAVECRLSVPLLARRFGVSVPAMKVRLEVLALLPDYMTN